MKEGPQANVVVSCRTRFARNLAGMPFPPRAKSIALQRVAETVKAAIADCERFREFFCVTIDAFGENDRHHLRESQVISQEMERGGEHRLVFIGADPITTIMVNEEDHLRVFVITPGLQMEAALDALIQVEDDLANRLEFAFSEQFGYLTACPTNTGTGLRASVMLHLPGLALTQEVDSIMQGIPNCGMAVRGIYGENSSPMGHFYQISNETTLGETEEQIVRRLSELINQVIEKEAEARDKLFSRQRALVEDKVFRAYSILAQSRIINTQEAIDHLSQLRLGIDHSLFTNLTHSGLNRLIVGVQPAHLQHKAGKPLPSEKRDVVRARLLREALADVAINN